MIRSRSYFVRLGLLLAGLCSLVLIGVLLAGGFNTGPAEGEVTGTVSLKGVGPLPGGEVEFVDEKGTLRTRVIGANGIYRVPGLSLGPKKIVVHSKEGRDGRDPISNAFGPKDGKRPTVKPALKIHARYNDFKTTDLEYTVVKGEQRHDIELDGP
jgi:hypothetical protein